MSNKNSESATNASPRTRMTPEARRAHIIEAARRLMTGDDAFSVSTADVAAAAGVTRALVHHYFHGIDDLRQAVALNIVQDAPRALHSDSSTPVVERVRKNVVTSLELIWVNRRVWLANLADRERLAIPSPAAAALRENMLGQMLLNNRDLIDDTPWARTCLDGYLGFSEAVCRRWVLDEVAREQVERALVETLLHLLLVTIPQGLRSERPQG